MQNLGDRIKENYENRYRFYLTRRTPVIIRLDGSAFHTFTRSFNRPFDPLIIKTMVEAATETCNRIQGFKCAYVQSDEVSILVTDYDTIETCAWFDYNKSKMETIAASMMTAFFQREEFKYVTKVTPFFDGRAFNIPKEEVVNYFLWRALDWERNSLNMYASNFFSHKELHGKNKADKHEMLHNIGKNWTKDLTAQQRNGTFIFKDGKEYIIPTYEAINNKIGDLV